MDLSDPTAPPSSSSALASDQVSNPLPLLDVPRVVALATSFGSAGRELWEDIRRLSVRFDTARGTLERNVAWHHLVMSVGNFKRQGGYRLQPVALDDLPMGVAADRFAVPGVEGLILDVENPASWSALNSAMRGFASATTTTLLAALWADRHFVYDRRVHKAANGIRLASDSGLATTHDVTRDGRGPAEPTMSTYEVVRSWVRACGDELGLDIVAVERALYVLDQRVGKPPMTGRSWGEYSDTLRLALETVQPG